MNISPINNINSTTSNFKSIVGIENLSPKAREAFCNNPEFDKLARIWESKGHDMHISEDLFRDGNGYARYFIITNDSFMPTESWSAADISNKGINAIQEIKNFSIQKLYKDV